MELTKKKLLGSQIRGSGRMSPHRKSRVSKRPTVSRIYEDRQQDLGTYRRIEIIGRYNRGYFSVKILLIEEEM